MFAKNTMPNRDASHEPETVIAASVKVEGDFSSEGNVLIEGMVEGSLRTERDLRVGERAIITADVSAANAIVAGEVKGNMTIGERLELEATAKVAGDVHTKVLVVASGAVINGKLAMGTEVIERKPRPATAMKTEVFASEPAKAVRAVEKAEAPEKEKKSSLASMFSR